MPVLTTAQEQTMHTLLKTTIRYSEDCCQKCKHFTPCDMGGSPGALPAHCSLNPSIALPVSEHGHCAGFVPKEIGD